MKLGKILNKIGINKKNENIISENEIFFKEILNSHLVDTLSLEGDKIFEIIDNFEGNITVEDLVYFMNKNNLKSNNLKVITIAKLIPKTYENIEKLKNLGLNPKYFLYQVNSSGEKAFNEILERTIKNKTDIYTEIRNIVKEFIEKNNIQKDIFSEQSSKKIVKSYNYLTNSKNLDLSLYIRYGHQIDFPEIAELIAIFCDEIGKNRSFKYFDKINILPRFSNKYTPKYLIKNLESANFYKVKGEEFEEKLSKDAVPIYLSHSTNVKSLFPNIISKGMRGNGESIKSKFELEKNKLEENKNGNLSCEEILSLFYGYIKEIEKRFNLKIEEESIKEKMKEILK